MGFNSGFKGLNRRCKPFTFTIKTQITVIYSVPPASSHSLLFLRTFSFIIFLHVLLVPFSYRFVYGCMFCILLFNSVSYVFLLLCLCILIVMYALFCILFANWHSPATLTEVFPCSFLGCKEMPRYNSQRRVTARTLPNKLTVLFYVLFCV